MSLMMKMIIFVMRLRQAHHGIRTAHPHDASKKNTEETTLEHPFMTLIISCIAVAYVSYLVAKWFLGGK